MDAVADTCQGPGQEVPIVWQGRRARAWLPAPLRARDLEVTPPTAHRTGEALSTVRAMSASFRSPWEPAARLLLRAEGLASSRIEGLRAPLADVAAAELDESAVDRTSAWVADNLAAVTDALSVAASSPLSVGRLQGWHRRLMRHSSLDPSMVGAFRTAQGWIGGTSPLDAAYVPPPPEQVPALVGDLLAFANSEHHDPIIQAAAVHAQFVTIHPYGDGNGRIGRLLVAWVLRRRIGVTVPPPVSALIARDVGGYLSGLYAFRTGEVDRWVAWFGRVLSRSAEATTAIMESVEELISAWRARLGRSREDALAPRLLELLPLHPVISSAVVAEETKVSDRTARRALAQLAQQGILQPFTPARRPAGHPQHWWVATELVERLGTWVS